VRVGVDRRVLVAVAGAVVLLGLVIVVIAFVRHGKSDGSTTTSSTGTGTVGATAAPPPPPPTTAPPPVASAEPTAPPPPAKPQPGPFHKRVAVAAIAENTKNLRDCRHRHGVWGKGQAGVQFRNDGSVRYVLMGPPFDGVEGRCVAKHIKKTHIDPYSGIVGPIYVNFVIPYY
jgi:hypothetical protein